MTFLLSRAAGVRAPLARSSVIELVECAARILICNDPSSYCVRRRPLSRRVVGWAMATDLRTERVLDSWTRLGIRLRSGPAGSRAGGVTEFPEVTPPSAVSRSGIDTVSAAGTARDQRQGVTRWERVWGSRKR